MRKSGLTGDEAYALSKHRKTTEDLGPLKKEIGLIKEDLGELSDIEESINIFDFKTVIIQKVLYANTGKLQTKAGSGWITSDFINIDSNKYYLLTKKYGTGRSTVNKLARLCFYTDSNEDSFISGLEMASTTFFKSGS